MISTSRFKLIAHRGLIEGPSKELENNLNNILTNIKLFPFLINEIDIWIDSENIYLGHDNKDNVINPEILFDNYKNLIIHFKGIILNTNESLKIFNQITEKCHYFVHQEDDFSITNKGWVWTHPRKGFVKNTICVLPEKFTSIDEALKHKLFSNLLGVCTDYPLKMLDLFN